MNTLGRLAIWTSDRRRTVVLVWCAIALGLGAFAPFADRTLSGAGWEASGSESVAARSAIERDFPGRDSSSLSVVMTHRGGGPGDGALRAADRRVRGVLAGDPAVAAVRTGAVSRDGRTAVVLATAGGEPREMVEAARRLKGRLAALSGQGVVVRLTGTSAMWSDFNDANKTAMMKSEVLSWPITLGLLVLVFGTLVAAGLPLLLTMAGLMGAGGLLFVLGHVLDVSIWAMNFAMMFAIALGIDYALFIVVRFRSALASGLEPREATAAAMETAGKAVLVSGLTVVAALGAVALVPVPAFRSVPIGIALAVLMVLAATLTLLPAALSGLGHRVNAGRVRLRGGVEHRSARFARWGTRLWARPLPYAAAALALLVVLAVPAVGLKTGMPGVSAVPVHAGSREGDALVRSAFGAHAPEALQVIVDGRTAPAAIAALEHEPRIAAVAPAGRSHGRRLITAVPASSDVAATIDSVRRELPPGALVGGAAAETRDVETALGGRLVPVVGLIVAVGFLLLVTLVRAPLAAAAAVLLNLLSSVAAFGVARLIFQDGALESLLGFQSHGFVDAWAPIFFFALVFALAMDYAVFLLATVKELYDRTGDPQHALTEGLARTGRVINGAAAVMVVVFMTFALTGPIAPKEMGVVLAVAVLLDATLVRLVLQPVILRLLGARAWWMPRWLDRLLPRLAVAHAAEARTPA